MNFRASRRLTLTRRFFRFVRKLVMQEILVFLRLRELLQALPITATTVLFKAGPDLDQVQSVFAVLSSCVYWKLEVRS